MSPSHRLRATLLSCALLATLSTAVHSGEVALYTGSTSWVDAAVADQEAQICANRLGAAGITATVFTDPSALATWVTGATGNGDVDALVLFGSLPAAIYPAANAMPEGSIAEAFIESTDGDAIINHGDWMFYVSDGDNNNAAGLQNIMDIGINMGGDNTPLTATAEGKQITPNLGDYYLSDRPLYLDQLAGEWTIEASLAQNDAGTRADPVIVRDGDRGRIVPALMSNVQAGDRMGAVASDIIAWIMGVELEGPNALAISGPLTSVTGTAVKYTVTLVDAFGVATAVAGDTVVDLESDSAAGAFDTTWGGDFDGSVTSVTIPAGEATATFHYKDSDPVAANLTAEATGLALGMLTVNVTEAVPADNGEVAIYTGNVGWITKEAADAQAQICVDKLDAMGVSSVWYDEQADQDALATWLVESTGNGEVDVLILYGSFPPTIYPNPNTMPDGSPAELFIESTDGDLIINHADWIFYVAHPGDFNGVAGLENMMDLPGIALWGDNLLMAPTAEGAEYIPSLSSFLTDRAIPRAALANDWFVEIAFAENNVGERMDPTILRDGNRGRVSIAFQAAEQNDPKGAVAAEMVAWLYGVDLGAPAQLGVLGQDLSFTDQPQMVTVQIQDLIGSPTTRDVDTVVGLDSSSGDGAFDIAADGAFDGTVTSVTIPAGEPSVDVYYQDATAGTPTLTASSDDLNDGSLVVEVLGRTFAPPGEVRIYTGNVNWIDKAQADSEAEICANRLTEAGVSNMWYSDPANAADLATWMTAATGNGELDVLVLYGWFPDSIYPSGNAAPDGSIAEAFIESTDGDAIINHGDWMFYVSTTNNGTAGLHNMMDVPGASMAGFDNAPMTVTPAGEAIAPSLTDFLTDRPLHLGTLGGRWLVEQTLAQSADGTVAEPVIVRDGELGRLIPMYQTNFQIDPKGAVSAEVIAWLMGTELLPSEVNFSGPSTTVTGFPAALNVQIQDGAGIAIAIDEDVTIDLASDSATGAFDLEKYGSFDGSLTSVTISAGEKAVAVYYQDSTAGTPTLTATVSSGPDLTAGSQQIKVLQDAAVIPGEVAIYTGVTGWITKELADAQAQICVDVLTAAEITNTWFASNTEETALSEWMDAATGNGQLDVLVLYGYLPDTIYPAGNAMPDGSIAELFIESTDGDVIMNHGDYMFYVSSTNNGPDGLRNMMDVSGITMDGGDEPVVVTPEGMEIAPSLVDFLTDRPFHVDELANDWYVEAALAENFAGTRVDPAIVRDGNRGRLISAHQAADQDDPKGQVGAEIITWLMANATGEEKPLFRRGDSDASGEVNITDGIYVLNFLFLGGPDPSCLESADADDSGAINITDGIYILNFLFLGGPDPLPPGIESCGPDPDDSAGDLGCEVYDEC